MKGILSILIILIFKISLGQNNWHEGQTSLFIDPIYVLKDSVSLGEIKFNYKRIHIDKNITEYGNVDTNNKANGQWAFKNKQESFFLKGKAENGYKVGRWTVQDCITAGSYFIYNWTTDKTKTQIDKAFRKKPKLKKHNGLLAK